MLSVFHSNVKTIRFAVCILFVLFVSLLVVFQQIDAQTQDRVGSVVYSPDGTFIAVTGGLAGCNDADPSQFGVRVFSATSMQLAKTLVGITCTPTSVAWKPDGTQLVAVNVAQSVAYIWDVASTQLLRTVPLRLQGVDGLQWSPSGNIISSSTPGNSALLWNPDTGERLGYVSGTAFDWSPDGNRMVTGSIYDNRVVVQTLVTSVGGLLTGQEIMLLNGTVGYTYDVEWSANNARIASVSSDSNARVWDANTGQLLLQLPVANLTNVRISPSGEWIATVSLDGRIDVWNVADALLRRSITGLSEVYTVAWSPDSTQLAYFDPMLNSIEIDCLTPIRQTVKMSEASKLPEGTIPPACAADLIAVAEAIQAGQ